MRCSLLHGHAVNGGQSIVLALLRMGERVLSFAFVSHLLRERYFVFTIGET